MTVRFLADEDLDSAIVDGLRSREPAIDILDSKQAGYRGVKDPLLLEMAAAHGRILVTHDRRTMTRYFHDRLAAGKSSPGLFIVPQRIAIGDVIESLVWYGPRPSPETGSTQLLTCPTVEIPSRQRKVDGPRRFRQPRLALALA